jgi:prepilin-type N-terminal cleavage/methylation domain-containing protein
MPLEIIEMKYQQGFSLIEIAIVLVIVGLLLGGLMTPLATQFENSKRNETQQTLETIAEALYGFALTQGRLPCPDTDNDGQENPLGGVGGCAVFFGNLPWATLNTGNSDAWGRPFIYRVTGVYADNTDGTGCGVATLAVSFSLCSNGNIQVLDAAVGNAVAATIPAIVLSRGANGAAAGADENENGDNDAVFVSKEYSTLAVNPFDDMVEWIVPTILNNRMVKAGKLP